MPSITLRQHTWRDHWDKWRTDRLVVSFLMREDKYETMNLLYVHHDYKRVDDITIPREEAEKLLTEKRWYCISSPCGIWLTNELAEQMDGRKRLWWYHEDYYDGEDLRSVKLLWLKLCWNQDMFDLDYWKEVVTEKWWPNTRKSRGYDRLQKLYTTFTKQFSESYGFSEPFKSPTTHPFAHLSHAINNALYARPREDWHQNTITGILNLSEIADALVP